MPRLETQMVKHEPGNEPNQGEEVDDDEVDTEFLSLQEEKRVRSEEEGLIERMQKNCKFPRLLTFCRLGQPLTIKWDDAFGGDSSIFKFGGRGEFFFGPTITKQRRSFYCEIIDNTALFYVMLRNHNVHYLVRFDAQAYLSSDDQSSKERQGKVRRNIKIVLYIAQSEERLAAFRELKAQAEKTGANYFKYVEKVPGDDESMRSEQQSDAGSVQYSHNGDDESSNESVNVPQPVHEPIQQQSPGGEDIEDSAQQQQQQPGNE